MRRQALRIITLLALVTVLGPSSAVADNGASELLKRVVGPYQLTVVASSPRPLVGHLYLWITVADASTATPVTDTQVQILTRRPGDATEGWALAIHSPAAPGTYTAEVILDEPGTWALSFQVSNGLGESIADIALEVAEVPQNRQVGTLGWTAMIGVIALGALYVWWSARRQVQQRQRGL